MSKVAALYRVVEPLLKTVKQRVLLLASGADLLIPSAEEGSRLKDLLQCRLKARFSTPPTCDKRKRLRVAASYAITSRHKTACSQIEWACCVRRRSLDAATLCCKRREWIYLAS